MKYTIPSRKLEEVSEKLEKIAKKCTKYNCDFTFEIGEEHVRRIDYNRDQIYDIKPEDTKWAPTVFIRFSILTSRQKANQQLENPYKIQ